MKTTKEYIRQVLSNVSFDKELFLEVLCETIISLDEKDLNEMKSWCLSEFGPDYAGEIRTCFDLIDQGVDIQEIGPSYQKRFINN